MPILIFILVYFFLFTFYVQLPQQITRSQSMVWGVFKKNDTITNTITEFSDKKLRPQKHEIKFKVARNLIFRHTIELT